MAPSDEVRSPHGFTTWLGRLAAQSHPTTTTNVGRHRCRYWWVVDHDRVLGGIALRDGDDEYTQWAGHLGHGIRPSERGRGLATWAVGQTGPRAGPGAGCAPGVAVCTPDNEVSIATITRNGGVFDAVRETPLGPTRRYWIDLTP